MSLVPVSASWCPSPLFSCASPNTSRDPQSHPLLAACRTPASFCFEEHLSRRWSLPNGTSSSASPALSCPLLRRNDVCESLTGKNRQGRPYPVANTHPTRQGSILRDHQGSKSRLVLQDCRPTTELVWTWTWNSSRIVFWSRIANIHILKSMTAHFSLTPGLSSWRQNELAKWCKGHQLTLEQRAAAEAADEAYQARLAAVLCAHARRVVGADVLEVICSADLHVTSADLRAGRGDREDDEDEEPPRFGP